MLVEVAGPAGAGKTTLLRELAGRARSSCAGIAPHGARDVPRAVAAALPLLGAFAELARRGPPPRREHARHLLRLDTLRGRARAAMRRHPIVLLDEGPVYSLARLRAFGACEGPGGALDRAWRRALAGWRGLLDAVVWLDAPDETLAGRIRARPTAHRAKCLADAELAEFLARYRCAYEEVLARLGADGGTRLIVLPPDTTAAARADRLLELLGAPAASGASAA